MYNSITLHKIDVNDGDILRYLGYNGQDIREKLRLDLLRCKALVLDKITPRFVCASYELEKTDSGIQLKATPVTLTGGDISKLLGCSSKCVLMAATLGSDVERLINQHQKTSMSDGVMMDAVATAAIEAVCDDIESQLRDIHPITWRYSCGYGDLPIELQPQILSALNTQKAIGLYCNEAHIMTPRKSVTAIMGIIETENKTENEAELKKNCSSCLYKESCLLKKGEKSHGAFGVHEE